MRYNLPPDARFRHFDFRLGTASIRPCRRTIRTSEDLEQEADRLDASAVYVSKYLLLQAKNAGRIHRDRKHQSDPADNVLLGGDFVLDLDAKNFSSLDACYAEIVRARKWFYSRWEHYRFDSDVIFSGRGYYFWAYRFWTVENPLDSNVKNRENAYKTELRKMVNMMVCAGFRFSQRPSPRAFDLNPALNTRQVFRVVGSKNHHNGEIVSIIDTLSVRRHPEREGVGAAPHIDSFQGPPMMSVSQSPTKTGVEGKDGNDGGQPTRPKEPSNPASGGLP